MIAQRVREFAARFDMLPAGAKVLCACSGGADSVCLLHLLHAMQDISVVCAHFNHGLRGAESDRDAAFVKALCDRLGIPCVTECGDAAAWAAAHGLGIEAAARELRYDFLHRAAAAHGCTRIATAHNAEDNAETVLMHLIRGSGGRGLSGIPPVRGSVVRPLLTVTRAEIAAYLAKNGLPHTEDSSNASDDYARNRIRHRVLPLLLEENSAAVEHICAAAELLRKDEDFLSDAAERFLRAAETDGAIPVAELLALPEPVAARVLHLKCPGATRTHIEALLALCAGDRVHGAADLPGMRAVLERGRLQFDPQAAAPLLRRELNPDGETLFPESGWRIECRRTRPGEEIHNSFNIFYFKSESICGRMFAASRGEGDRVRLAGRGCTKTLKKLFAEAAIPLAQRQSVPVLYDDAGVIAVSGFGIAERCVPAPGERALRVEITKL